MAKVPDYRRVDFSLSPYDRVQNVLTFLRNRPSGEGWDQPACQNVKIISASPGKSEFEFTVAPGMLNGAGSLHGGCAATILDSLTSTALTTLAKPGYLDNGHVSRTLTCTYLRPPPLGARMRVVCEVVSAGKTLANVRGQIETWDGKVCVTCVHDKAVLPSSKL